MCVQSLNRCEVKVPIVFLVTGNFSRPRDTTLVSSRALEVKFFRIKVPVHLLQFLLRNRFSGKRSPDTGQKAIFDIVLNVDHCAQLELAVLEAL
jgi:hypothetical protein